MITKLLILGLLITSLISCMKSEKVESLSFAKKEAFNRIPASEPRKIDYRHCQEFVNDPKSEFPFIRMNEKGMILTGGDYQYIESGDSTYELIKVRGLNREDRYSEARIYRDARDGSVTSITHGLWRSYTKIRYVNDVCIPEYTIRKNESENGVYEIDFSAAFCKNVVESYKRILSKFSDPEFRRQCLSMSNEIENQMKHLRIYSDSEIEVVQNSAVNNAIRHMLPGFKGGVKLSRRSGLNGHALQDLPLHLLNEIPSMRTSCIKRYSKEFFEDDRIWGSGSIEGEDFYLLKRKEEFNTRQNLDTGTAVIAN